MKKWIYINGEKTQYKISSKGFVISTSYKGKEGCVKKLKHSHDKDGYCIITLNHKGKKYTRKIHRLVAEAFIPNPNDLPEVNHMNSDKDDNDYKNLEWVTTKMNIFHAVDNDLRYRTNFPEYVEMACQLLQDNELTLREISEFTGINIPMLRRIKNKTRWTVISDKYDFSNYDKDGYIRGSENKATKINEEVANEICRRLENKESPTIIAKDLGITRKIVYSIRNRDTWTYVSINYDF